MSAAPALVLFDLDGVLVRYDREKRLASLARSTGKSMAEVKAALFDSGLEADSDRGVYTAQSQADEFARRLGAPATLDDGVRARAASISATPEMLALAAEVSRAAGVAILTNNGLMVRDYLPQICPPLFPLFSARVFCSAQFKIEKPDPEIYKRCLAALGIAEERAIFVDDNSANVEGAIRAGLLGHHFTDPPSLRSELRALGLVGENHAT
jgi:glucose-1-phosphatase